MTPLPATRYPRGAAPRPVINDDQFGLFPEDHPAMRQRTPAEFTPEEFREKPGAWHHGTFAPAMPKASTTPGSAGIHLGTLAAAQERLDQFGERDHSLAPPRPGLTHSDAGEIHTRRLNPSVEDPYEPGEMRRSESNPGSDLGSNWNRSENSWGDYSERSAHTFGEYYRNDTEDEGSVSIRVPNDNYLSSHRGAVDKAIRAGNPVHPLVRGLIENHGGVGVDEPMAHVAPEDDRPPVDRITEHGAHQSDPGQPMLLPYKISANPNYGIEHGAENMPHDSVLNRSLDPPKRHYLPAQTVATKEDAEAATAGDHYPGGMQHLRKWAREYRNV